MCRIFGVSCNRPTDIKHSMRWFQKLSTTHSSGWGVGWIHSGKETIIKRPMKALTDNQFSNTIRQARAKIILAHLRLASEGDETYENTHPFFLRIHDKPFLFEHNGTLANKSSIPILSKKTSRSD